jgi:hypothetical protein
MKQGLIAPQFGLAAKRVAEDIEDFPDLHPATMNVVAYSGSSAVKPTIGPTVVVKTVKRRKLEVGAKVNGADAPPQDGTMAGSPPEGEFDGPKSPKVFRLTPQRQVAPLADSRPTEMLASSENVGADSLDSTSTAATLPSAVPRRRRRRDPVTAPVLVRHVVFVRQEAEDNRQPELQIRAPSGGETSYESVCLALHQLRGKVEAVMRVRELLTELDALTHQPTEDSSSSPATAQLQASVRAWPRPAVPPHPTGCPRAAPTE